MGKKDDKEKDKEKDNGKKVGSASKDPVFQYKLKTPSMFDFYEGEAPLDWDAIQAADPVRVIFQATVGRHGRHGDDKPDRQVANYVAEARARGLKYGLYHLLQPNSIAEQARFYIDTVRSLGGPGDMEPIVDIEYEPDPKDKKALRGKDWGSQIKVWLDIVTDAFGGVKPMIYTSAKYWVFTLDRDRQPPSWTPDYRLWTAGYPDADFVDKNPTCPPVYLPPGWKKWAIWQYAEDGGFRKHPANDLNLVHEDYVSFLNRPVAVRPGAELAPDVSGKEMPQAAAPAMAFSIPGVGDGMKPGRSGKRNARAVTAADGSSLINIKLDMLIELEFEDAPSKTLHVRQVVPVRQRSKRRTQKARAG